MTNRDKEELKASIDAFIKSIDFQHDIEISYLSVQTVALRTLGLRVNQILESKMDSFSIPELNKIVSICIQADQASRPKEEPAKQVRKKRKQDNSDLQ